MLSAEEFLDLLNCTIRFSTPEGDVYEGLLKRVVPTDQSVTVGKLYLLPKRTKMGVLRFTFRDVLNVVVIRWPDLAKEVKNEKKQETSNYVRTEVDEFFDLYGDSENEDEARTDKIPIQGEHVMKLPPHLSNCIPAKSCIIDSYDDDFNLAIQTLKEEDAIGLSLEGPKISRSGILTWMCISTSSCVYLFDVLKLGKAVFKKGLKFILENSRIQKILHDCRLPSDCLYHQYNVRLVNVFDTQVADSLALMQEIVNQRISKRVNSLDVCLQYFLEIPDDYLYGPKNFVVDENSIDFHGLRPLRHEFQDLMIQNVIYLPLLKRELEFALLTPLRRATDIYLNVVQKATDYELLLAPSFPDELPPELTMEGIQVIRFQEYEYVPPVVSSGPPYRKLNNPFEEYKEYCKKYNIGRRKHYSNAVDTESDGGVEQYVDFETAPKRRTIPKLRQLINSRYDSSCSGVGNNVTVPVVGNQKNDDIEENGCAEDSSVDGISSVIPVSENQTNNNPEENMHSFVEQPTVSDLEQLLSRREFRRQAVLKENTTKEMQKNNCSQDNISSVVPVSENPKNDIPEENMHYSVEQEFATTSDLEQVLSRVKRRGAALRAYNFSAGKFDSPKNTFQIEDSTTGNKENKSFSFLHSLHNKDEGESGNDVSLKPVKKVKWQSNRHSSTALPGVQTFSDIEKMYRMEVKKELSILESPTFGTSDDIWTKLRAEGKNDYLYDEPGYKLNLIPAGMGC